MQSVKNSPVYDGPLILIEEMSRYPANRYRSTANDRSLNYRNAAAACQIIIVNAGRAPLTETTRRKQQHQQPVLRRRRLTTTVGSTAAATTVRAFTARVTRCRRMASTIALRPHSELTGRPQACNATLLTPSPTDPITRLWGEYTSR